MRRNVHNHFNQERHLIDRKTFKTAAQPPWLRAKRYG
jgi:hypothetical protein